MPDFRFANPQWSGLIWIVVAVVVALVWLQHRQHRVLQRFMSATMQARLVSRPPAIRRWSAIACLGLSAACLVVALMRPQYGLTFVKTPRVGAQIMFCLDVSNSMLAEDTAPNRLERAKADIADLVSFLDGDQVGLIGFAGRAAVLCPLTPDYGFFKLILDDANSRSVGRGGTRLEEPLRKALDGFRSESDVSRIVVLITDGEDHDSHPLDVAKEAVERGIRVIAIGFGDEAGSEIRITDPRTGIQTTVKDADGNPVKSRLDGELLRELALATEGVYIPAGVGNLDLQSIYDAHIRPLVRDQLQSEGRPVRREAFQWAVLCGIVFLLIAVALGSAPAQAYSDQPGPAANRSAAAAVIALAVLTIGHPATADGEDPVAPAKTETTAQPIDATPRETYNRSLKQLETDFDAAEQLLSTARAAAGSDGEVRFRSTYNMGWVEVKRADEQLQEDPEAALEHLQKSAGWFRDAIRLRKDHADARHNLDVVLRRILELRDQLSRQDDKDLAGQLDEVIETQRSVVGQVRGLVDQVANSDDPNIADRYRGEFLRDAVQERTLLSDLQDVIEKATGEFDTLQGKPDDERSAEDNVRMAQLTGVISYLNRANQRIGQARSQLRRRQASRAFRRSAAGLGELKRARDQLRDPLQRLDGILADASSATRETSLKSLEKPLIAAEDESPPVPAWITHDYLADTQADLSSRTTELTAQLSAGLEERPTAADGSSDPNQDQQRQEFVALLREAMPYLREADEAMIRAGELIQTTDYDGATEQQAAAIAALQEARERFADIRTLIELAFAAEFEIAAVLAAVTNPDSKDNQLPELPQVRKLLAANQLKNIDRMKRLQQKVATEIQNLKSQPPQQSDPADPDSAQSDPAESPELQRMLAATQLIQSAVGQMQNLTEQLASETDSEPADEPETPAETADQDPADEQQATDDETSDPEATDPQTATSDLVPSRQTADRAVRTLEDLRRLFFSVIEHLQDTARQQSRLNDQTEQAAGLQSEVAGSATATPDENTSSTDQQKSQQLESKQQGLSQMSQRIAETLQQQAEAAAAPPSDPNAGDPQQQAQIQQAAQNAGQAATLVTEASQQMDLASEQLGASVPEFASARPAQDQALDKLIEAINLLQPPQQDQEQDQDQSQDQNQDQGQGQQQDDQSSPQQDQQQPSETAGEPQGSDDDPQIDPSRILQAVRDREAQRRREKDRRLPAASIPVEKDW